MCETDVEHGGIGENNGKPSKICARSPHRDEQGHMANTQGNNRFHGDGIGPGRDRGIILPDR